MSGFTAEDLKNMGIVWNEDMNTFQNASYDSDVAYQKYLDSLKN